MSSSIRGYYNIDDLVFDSSTHIDCEIFASAIDHTFDFGPKNIPNYERLYDERVPEDLKDEWYNFLWHYDVREWKECDDGDWKHYGYRFCEILEYKAYALREKMITWIQQNPAIFPDLKYSKEFEQKLQ